MSQKEYVRVLNEEIQKLNKIIDRKILGEVNYVKEAKRHKLMLTKLRKEEARRLLGSRLRLLIPAVFRA